MRMPLRPTVPKRDASGFQIPRHPSPPPPRRCSQTLFQRKQTTSLLSADFQRHSCYFRVGLIRFRLCHMWTARHSVCLVRSRIQVQHVSNLNGLIGGYVEDLRRVLAGLGRGSFFLSRASCKRDFMPRHPETCSVASATYQSTCCEAIVSTLLIYRKCTHLHMLLLPKCAMFWKDWLMKS